MKYKDISFADSTIKKNCGELSWFSCYVFESLDVMRHIALGNQFKFFSPDRVAVMQLLN